MQQAEDVIIFYYKYLVRRIEHFWFDFSKVSRGKDSKCYKTSFYSIWICVMNANFVTYALHIPLKYILILAYQTEWSLENYKSLAKCRNNTCDMESFESTNLVFHHVQEYQQHLNQNIKNEYYFYLLLNIILMQSQI